MDVLPVSYMPGDPLLIDKIVCELKSQGIFDSFRKECISDVDTKPAYQNLRQRVEGSVAGFLRKQKWKPDMNKNQVREMLRKNIHESGFLETGVERIVDQVVNPKMNTVFLPKVTDVVYKYLGINRPSTEVERQERREISIENLLPKDLEAVSPESGSPDRKDDHLDDSFNLDDCKIEEDESPPFEPISEQVYEENSIDSHLSGFSGLLSHDSNQSDGQRPLQIDMDTQMSKHSSDGHSSLIFNDDQNSKMEISEDSRLDSNSKGFEGSDKSSSSIKFDIPAEKDKKDESVEKKEEAKEEQRVDKDKKKDRHRSDKHRSRTESRSDRKDVKKSSDHDNKDKYSSKDRDKKDDKGKSDREKDRHKSSSSKHSHDRSSSRKDSTSKGDSKHHSESKDKKDHKQDSKDKSKEKSHTKDSKSNDDKNRLSSNSKHDKDKKVSNLGSKRDKEKDKKDPKRRGKDDHYSSKHRPERRSTDRDSNDGSGLKSSSSSYSESNSSSQNSSSQATKPQDTSTSNSNDSGNSDAVEHRHPITLTCEDLNNGEFLIGYPQERRLIKPKFASNIHEARRLMKIRKQLKEIEKQNGIVLEALNNSIHRRSNPELFVEKIPVVVEEPVIKEATQESQPVTPATRMSVSMATWDALEAKLNETVKFDTYYDPESPAKPCKVTVTDSVKDETVTQDTVVDNNESESNCETESVKEPVEASSSGERTIKMKRKTEDVTTSNKSTTKQLKVIIENQIEVTKYSNNSKSEDMYMKKVVQPSTSGQLKQKPECTSPTTSTKVIKIEATKDRDSKNCKSKIEVAKEVVKTSKLSDRMTKLKRKTENVSPTTFKDAKIEAPKDNNTRNNKSEDATLKLRRKTENTSPTLIKKKTKYADSKINKPETKNAKQSLKISVSKQKSPTTNNKVRKTVKAKTGNTVDDCLYFSADGSDEVLRKNFADCLTSLEVEINEMEAKLALSICNNVPTVDAEELNKENKRIGAKRKISDRCDSFRKMKNNNNLTDVSTHEEKFSLPLSPSDSDKSVDKKNDSDGQISKQRRSNKKLQRYSNEDLYKPRPFITRTTSRRRNVKLD